MWEKRAALPRTQGCCRAWRTLSRCWGSRTTSLLTCNHTGSSGHKSRSRIPQTRSRTHQTRSRTHQTGSRTHQTTSGTHQVLGVERDVVPPRRHKLVVAVEDAAVHVLVPAGVEKGLKPAQPAHRKHCVTPRPRSVSPAHPQEAVGDSQDVEDDAHGPHVHFGAVGVSSQDLWSCRETEQRQTPPGH